MSVLTVQMLFVAVCPQSVKRWIVEVINFTLFYLASFWD